MKKLIKNKNYKLQKTSDFLKILQKPVKNKQNLGLQSIKKYS